MELGNRGGDLESLVEDTLLALNADVLGPLHEPGEVSLWLDVTSQSEVAGVLLKERVLGVAGTSSLAALDHNLSLNSFLDLQESRLGGQHEQTNERQAVSLALAHSTYHND